VYAPIEALPTVNTPVDKSIERPDPPSSINKQSLISAVSSLPSKKISDNSKNVLVGFVWQIS
jgi:hypothetical protein